MTKFKYIAQPNKPGSKSLTGTVEAKKREDVISYLEKRSLKPISITEEKAAGLSFGNLMGGKKVKSDELVIFTRQLSAMVGAGVPLTRALTSLADHAENPAFKSVLNEIISDVEEGTELASSLEKHPNVFGDVYVNMVRAGESAGILDEILKRLATQQEKSATMRKKIKSAMAYPTVLMVITVLAFFGLMLFVIPRIGSIITNLGGPDAELPLLTRAMLEISDIFISYWFIVFPLIFAAIYALSRYVKTPGGKLKFHTLVLKVPAVKTIIRKVAVARFARTYASLIGAGVSVLEALTVTARGVGNLVFEKAIIEAAARVEEGEPLSKILEEHEELFPAILSQMVAVGEETGQTDTVLVKVADFYEEEVDVAIDGISSIIEPVMILIMGSMVGLIAASVLGPIAGIANQIQ